MNPDEPGLDEAWAAAEAALPGVPGYDPSRARFVFAAQGDGTWYAGLEGAWHATIDGGHGPTPAAALLDLARWLALR